jgi:hypothetical protein
MKDNNLTQDCIIGGDFLNAHDVMLIKRGDELIIRQLNDLHLSAKMEITSVCAVSEVSLELVFGDVDLAT